MQCKVETVPKCAQWSCLHLFVFWIAFWICTYNTYTVRIQMHLMQCGMQWSVVGWRGQCTLYTCILYLNALECWSERAQWSDLESWEGNPAFLSQRAPRKRKLHIFISLLSPASSLGWGYKTKTKSWPIDLALANFTACGFTFAIKSVTESSKEEEAPYLHLTRITCCFIIITLVKITNIFLCILKFALQLHCSVPNSSGWWVPATWVVWGPEVSRSGGVRLKILQVAG